MLLSDELGGQIEGFQKAFLQKVEDVINLAGALSRVVDHVVEHVLLDAGKLQVNTENDIVRVDPFIERARQAVLAMRRRVGATNDRLSFAKTPSGEQVVDLSALIRRRS